MIVGKDEIRDSLTELPAFPRVVLMLLETLNDDNASTRTLVEQLSHDPILTGKVLAAANRGSMRLHAAPVTNIRYAAALVGTQRIRELALTASLVDYTGFLGRQAHFQEHALAVGICAQELAVFAEIDTGLALVAGLLHDIGHIWMAHCHPRAMDRVAEHVDQDVVSLCEMESSDFGMCHCAIGGEIARLWGLPDDLCDAIGQHHHAARTPPPKLVALTQAAEAICNGLDLPYRPYNEVGTLADGLFERLHLDPGIDLPDVFGRLDARYQYSQESWI